MKRSELSKLSKLTDRIYQNSVRYDCTWKSKIKLLLIFWLFLEYDFLWMKLELREETDQHDVIQHMATKSRQDLNEIGFREWK